MGTSILWRDSRTRLAISEPSTSSKAGERKEEKKEGLLGQNPQYCLFAGLNDGPHNERKECFRWIRIIRSDSAPLEAASITNCIEPVDRTMECNVSAPKRADEWTVRLASGSAGVQAQAPILTSAHHQLRTMVRPAPSSSYLTYIYLSSSETPPWLHAEHPTL